MKIEFEPPVLSPVLGTGHGLFSPKIFEYAADWTITIDGETFTIQKGDRTDFASVPRFVQMFLSAASIYSIGAEVHDMLYYTGRMPKEVADAWFHAILRDVDKIHWFSRGVMWFALILFGQWAWNEHRKAGHPNRKEQSES